MRMKAVLCEDVDRSDVKMEIVWCEDGEQCRCGVRMETVWCKDGDIVA